MAPAARQCLHGPVPPTLRRVGSERRFRKHPLRRLRVRIGNSNLAGRSSKSSSQDDHRMITASGKRATPITVATTLLVAVLTTETVLAILFET